MLFAPRAHFWRLSPVRFAELAKLTGKKWALWLGLPLPFPLSLPPLASPPAALRDGPPASPGRSWHHGLHLET